MLTTLFAFVAAGAVYLDPTHDYAVIAEAITNVVESEPPLFRGDLDKHRTASLILAIGWREGSLRLSVHGDCDKSKPGEPCKGKPHSFCSWQLHDSSGGTEAHNDDPELCVRTAMGMLRTSMHTCSAHPIAFYAAGPGACENVRAQRISRDRVALAQRVFVSATDALKEER